jgi:uncharacterized membrane protein
MRAKNETEVKRLGGYLYKVTPVKDEEGNVLDHLLRPLMVEFKPRDILQVVVGSSLLAIPMAFTAEAWDLGVELPLKNVVLLAALSIFFVALFVYFNFYRYYMKRNKLHYVVRVLATYIIAFAVVALLLTILGKCPWGIDNLLALKRIIIVAFPASMSATVSDVIK